MRIKILELRDKSTFIPIMAIDMVSENEQQRWLLRRAGYAGDLRCVFLVRCQGGHSACDPYDWQRSRTMTNAHQYIVDHWTALNDGDVIDVEFILGETKAPKRSEREEVPWS